MSTRQILADARIALAVRRVQEQAALYGLQAQRQAEAQARTRLEALNRTQTNSEAAWEAMLRRPIFDPAAETLWRSKAQAALRDVKAGEAMLAKEIKAVQASKDQWETQVRLADAAETMTRSAARRAQRSDDAARLADAEDVARARSDRR